jgi:ABC-type multidrug transport system fused ATPase/permease subunit
MVNKSNVDAVNKAIAERNQAIKDKKEGIREAQSRASHEIYEACQKQQKAERKANEATETLERRSFLYIGLLAFTLLCNCIMNSVVVSDLLDFFKVPSVSIYESACDYIEWLINLSSKLETGWLWTVRILLTLLIIIVSGLIIIGLYSLIKWYMSRWCTLSLKVMVITIAVISIFGEPIRSLISVNLILLFFLVQILYLFVLWYFDGYYETRSKTDEWKEIQNR